MEMCKCKVETLDRFIYLSTMYLFIYDATCG